VAASSLVLTWGSPALAQQAEWVRLFFDDFESGVLNPAKWEDPGDWIIVNTNVKDGSYAAYCVAMAPKLTLWCNLTSKNLNYGFMLHVWARFWALSGSAGYPELFRDSDGQQVYSVMVYFGQFCYDHVGSNPTPWPANNAVSASTYYRMELGFDFQNNKQRCWRSGYYMGEIDLKDISGGSVTGIIYYGPAAGYHVGEDVWLDDCYIRKWVHSVLPDYTWQQGATTTQTTPGTNSSLWALDPAIARLALWFGSSIIIIAIPVCLTIQQKKTPF
jgi:hypothetical protein